MGGKKWKKRKNSSQGESAHTSKSNKEAKSGSPGVVSDNSFNNSQLSSSQYLYSSPCVTTSNPFTHSKISSAPLVSGCQIKIGVTLFNISPRLAVFSKFGTISI